MNNRNYIAIFLVIVLSILLLCSCGVIREIDDNTVEKLLREEGYTKYEKQFGDWVDYTSSNQHVEYKYYASKSGSDNVDLVTLSFYPRDNGGFTLPEYKIKSTNKTWNELD